MNFTIGDVVMLKSGGPMMTVKSIEGEELLCVFFAEETEQFREERFAHPLLVAVDMDEEDEEDEDEEDEDDEEDETPRKGSKR